MPCLTLEQVKKAQLFAWSDGGAMWIGVYAPVGRDFLFVQEDRPMGVLQTDWTWETCPDESGWHHLPGCDCRYCKEAP